MMLGPETNVGIVELRSLFRVLDMAAWKFGLKGAQCGDERTR